MVSGALVLKSKAIRNTVKSLHSSLVILFPPSCMCYWIPTVIGTVHGVYISLQFPVEVGLRSEVTNAGGVK